ncbi:polyamine aminopropyltransferase [Streptomyces sp. SDr-06]|uniref:polyamine aminopropyltransferase n=1 Tax=Streptomyces sp. SDr-06 TaxID=2267702 RepID=UPI001CB8BCC0|nr:polyamine aminopropyltransferase [Streptomyces sp. SDr-06]
MIEPLPAPVSSPRSGRFLVLAVVFVCAACGLVYELELVALASYLIGDSVTQASVVLSVMVFAMGVGSLLAKRLRCRAAVGFGLIEAALALVGGCSAMALYATFAWFGGSRYALVAFSLAIGMLIGAEIPLLMTLIQRVSRRAAGDASGTVADLFAADYVGALVGGLAFPFLLLPELGQLTSALLTGAVNAVAGGALVLLLFGRDLSPRARWSLLAANALVLAVLALTTAMVDDFEQAARRAVYGGQVRVAVQTRVQEIVLTGKGGGPLDLFLDGRLRVNGSDASRRHAALVGPALDGGPHGRVLILGGGDGLAAREVLRRPGVRSVTLVELDPVLIQLARRDPELAALNGHAYRDPRLHPVIGDPFGWLRGEGYTSGPYDVIVSDLPDPGMTASTKLYSQEFYGLAARVLAPGGRLVVHAGPVAGRPRTFWTVASTVRAAGLTTFAYRATGAGAGLTGGPGHASGPARTPRDWGFVLAARPAPRPFAADAGPSGSPPAVRLPAGAEPLAPPEDAARFPPSTLVHPRYSD